MIGSYVRNRLFSKATRLGVSYTEHLFLTLRVVTGKLSNRSLKTMEMNYSKGLQVKNTDNHFQESEQNSPSSSVLSRRGEDSRPDTFVRSFSTALAGKALTFGNILSPKNRNNTIASAISLFNGKTCIDRVETKCKIIAVRSIRSSISWCSLSSGSYLVNHCIGRSGRQIDNKILYTSCIILYRRGGMRPNRGFHRLCKIVDLKIYIMSIHLVSISRFLI